MKFTPCGFCRNRADWLLAGTRWHVCSSCRKLARERNWDELARRWVRSYPEDWVADVSAFIEQELGQGEPGPGPSAN